ncbi:PKD domain-containing protein [Paraglaciecola aestuariivivens]
MLNKWFNSANVFVIFLMVFSACGGGGGDDSTPIPTPVTISPTVSAGADFSVTEGESFTLVATGSDPDGSITSVQWTQTAGTSVDLGDANTANLNLVAPMVNSDEVLSFTVTVVDNDGAAATDTVKVTVINNNQAPQVDAGEDQSLNEKSSFKLVASASDSDGSIASYAWTQTAGTTVDLGNANTASLTLTAPSVENDETLTFSVTVLDDEGASNTDSVNVTVINVNLGPSVNAGTDQSVDEEASFSLLASASDPDGSIVSYAWSQTSGSLVDLGSADSANLELVAPSVTEDETLSFEVTVTDNHGETASDSVLVQVNNVNKFPTVELGDNLTINEGAEFTLVANATDSDGSIVSYQWTQTSGIEFETAATNQASLEVVAPYVSEPIVVTFEVIVTDNQGATAVDNISVTVANINTAPVAEAGEQQSVDETQGLTLVGSGTDTDGSIVSQLWTQTSGPRVTLENDDTESASFVAPTVTEDTELIFEYTVTDNNGESHTDRVKVLVVNKESGISGKLTFERFGFVESTNLTGYIKLDVTNPIQTAAKKVVVEVLNSSDEVVASTITNETGVFHFAEENITSGQNYRLLAKAQLELDDQVNDGFKIVVVDQSTSTNLSEQQLYTFETESFLYEGDYFQLDIHLTAGWDQSNNTFDSAASFAQPFAILDTLYKTAEFLIVGGIEFQDSLNSLYINWTRQDGYSESKSGFFELTNNRIFLNGYIGHANTADASNYPGAEEFNEHTISHEFIHFYQKNLIGRDDTRGGEHEGFEANDLRLALSEGMANALSFAALNDWRDLRMPADIISEVPVIDLYSIAQSNHSDCMTDYAGENNTTISLPCYRVSPFSEHSNAYFILSLIDTQRDATKWTSNLSASIGLSGLHQAMLGAADSEAAMTIYSLAEQVKQAFPKGAGLVNDLGEKLNMQFADEWGTGQTAIDFFTLSNGQELPSFTYLPIYTELEGQDETALCFNGGGLQNNDYRPGVLRYVRYKATLDGMLTVTVPDALDSQSKRIGFHFYAHTKGQESESALFYPNGNIDQFEFFAYAGKEYIIPVQIRDYERESEIRFDEPETVCSSISVVMQ